MGTATKSIRGTPTGGGTQLQRSRVEKFVESLITLCSLFLSPPDSKILERGRVKPNLGLFGLWVEMPGECYPQ